MEHSDTELVTLCLSGQREAFSTLVDRHRDAVFNLAYHMTGHYQDSADLAQEAFIRAFQKLHSYKPEYSFKNWVMGICANLTRNRFRGEARRRALETRHWMEQDSAPAPEPHNPRHLLLEKALSHLPEQARAPLVLKYMEGLSLEEIAQSLRLGLSAVKMRIVRAREELLQHIRRLELEEGREI